MYIIDVNDNSLRNKDVRSSTHVQHNNGVSDAQTIHSISSVSSNHQHVV